MIGVVSHEADLHTQEVGRHLDALGAPWVLVDTARLPRAVGLTVTTGGSDRWGARWEPAEPADGPALDAQDLRVMWWRRPQPFVLHDDVRGPQDRAFAHGECAAAVAGLWSCLDAVWVNDPDRDDAASRKMWQLQVASRVGLRVPRTCMTNDPARARAFVAAEAGGAIFKSFSATPSTWRETRPVRQVDLDLMDTVRFAPVIFQEAVPGSDVRVTMIGSQVFAAEFRTQDSAYPFDFRMDTVHCPTSPHELPAAVVEGLRRLMAELGLVYGAVDLRRDGDEYVFLEVNPAGQWLFVEYATGQPIAAAIAGELARLDRERPRPGRATRVARRSARPGALVGA